MSTYQENPKAPSPCPDPIKSATFANILIININTNSIMKIFRQFLGLFLLPLLLTTSCAQDAFPALVGKYKLNGTADDTRMLEIGKDSILAIYSLAGGFKLRLQILEVSDGKMTVTSIPEQGGAQNAATDKEQQMQTGMGIQKTVTEPKISQWHYTLTDSLFTLQDIKTGKKEVAVNCKTGACDFQKEFFGLCWVDVDLPFDSAHRYEAFPIVGETKSFYFGPRNSSFAAIYGSGSAIFVNSKFIMPQFLATEIQGVSAPIPKSELKIIGFIDHKTEMRELKTLLGYLANDGIREIYLAVRENKDVSEPLQVRLAKLEFKSLENAALKGNVGDWINGKK